MKYNITFASDLTIKGAGIKEMEGAKRRFLGNGNYQQGTAIIIKMFWWRNVNLCEWNVNLCEWNVTAKLMSTYKNR